MVVGRQDKSKWGRERASDGHASNTVVAKGFPTLFQRAYHYQCR